MKKFFLVLTLLIGGYYACAQDKVVLRTGDTLNVVVTKNTDSIIEFTYPNETVVNEKSKKDISCILFSSGRREEIKRHKIEIPQINDKDDWEKVVLTTNADDVEGLNKVKSISVSSYTGSLKTAFASLEKKHEETIMRLKKKAAKMNCGIILVTSERLRDNKIWEIAGDAYQ